MKQNTRMGIRKVQKEKALLLAKLKINSNKLRRHLVCTLTKGIIFTGGIDMQK